MYTWLTCGIFVQLLYKPVTSCNCFREFPYSVRTGFPQRSVSKAIFEVLKLFKWRKIGIVYDSNLLSEKA